MYPIKNKQLESYIEQLKKDISKVEKYLYPINYSDYLKDCQEPYIQSQLDESVKKNIIECEQDLPQFELKYQKCKKQTLELKTLFPHDASVEQIKQRLKHELKQREMNLPLPFFDREQAIMEKTDKHGRHVIYTFGQLIDDLTPGEYTGNMYERWSAIQNKQHVMDMIFEFMPTHDGFDFKNITKYVDQFIFHITYLISFSYNEGLKGKFVIPSLRETFNELMQTATHMSLVDKSARGNLREKGYVPATYLKIPGSKVELKWYSYLSLILFFMKKLPENVQLAWMEVYITSWAEGYDLKVCSFPQKITTFMKDNQNGPSCFSGALYHLLISLYSVISGSKAPPLPHYAKIQILNGYAATFPRGDETETGEDGSPERKTAVESYASKFRQYLLTKVSESNTDPSFWEEAINEVVEGATQHLYGLKKRLRKSHTNINKKSRYARKSQRFFTKNKAF